jgi:hypothetical protein
VECGYQTKQKKAGEEAKEKEHDETKAKKAEAPDDEYDKRRSISSLKY